MLPELNFKKSWGIDTNFYFKKKLKQFFTINENTNEQVSKYNAWILPIVRETGEKLGIQRRKFGMLLYVALNIKDYEAARPIRVIHNSIKEQLRMINLLDKYLLRVRIDEKWAKAIKELTCDSTLKRCNRLEEVILPDLIKISKLNIYAYHLETLGKTLDKDIAVHIQDDDKTYYSFILSTIEQCEQEMPKEKLYEFNNAREQYIALREKRKENGLREKAEREAEKRKDFEKDASVMLQQWTTDIAAAEQRICSLRYQALYSKALRILDRLNDMLTGEELSFKIISVTKYNRKNSIRPSSFQWLHITESNNYTLAESLGCATPFFDSLEPEKYNAALEYCKNQRYVIATASYDITGKKKDCITYDYYKAVPMQTWKGYRSFKTLTMDERTAFMERLIHETMNTLKCALVIEEAYLSHAESTNPISIKANTKILRLNLEEVNESIGCWNDESFMEPDGKDYEECRILRTRLTKLQNKTIKELSEYFDFISADSGNEWIDMVKSIVNLNSYTKKDLKALYDTLEKHRAKTYE